MAAKHEDEKSLLESALDLQAKLEAFLRNVTGNRSIYKDIVDTQTRIDEEPLAQEDQAELQQVRADLNAIARTMPPRTRSVFRLNRVEGLEHHEIAERLNMRVSTVKKHLATAVLIIEIGLRRLDNERLHKSTR